MTEQVKIKFKTAIQYGHVKLDGFYKFEEGRMVYYGYRIEYDQSGKEINRTKPEPLGSMWWER